jgi:hypothetical protein
VTPLSKHTDELYQLSEHRRPGLLVQASAPILCKPEGLTNRIRLQLSNFSANGAERKAWQILYLLQRFVEAFGRFPRLRRIDESGNSELTDFLQNHLSSKTNLLLTQIPLKEQGKVGELLGISKHVEIPPFRHLDISRLRDAGDQIRVSLHRTLSVLGLELGQRED